MTFSDRLGLTQRKSAFQADDIDDDLRNGLWEACSEYYLKDFGDVFSNGKTVGPILKDIFVNLWKLSSDNIGLTSGQTFQKIRQAFFRMEWFEVYNFIEFLSGCATRNFRVGTNINFFDPSEYDARFRARVNFFLEREKSAYRFAQHVLVPISSELEVSSIEDAMTLSDKFSGARVHIRQAVSLFGQKPNPDYRNAVKEAMSAVESTVRLLTGDKKATLGDALKTLDRIRPLHPAFKQAMDKLYGYTSDEGGVRHSLIDLSRVDEADAKFMIVACSAFVNFCVQRS